MYNYILKIKNLLNNLNLLISIRECGLLFLIYCISFISSETTILNSDIYIYIYTIYIKKMIVLAIYFKIVWLLFEKKVCSTSHNKILYYMTYYVM